jgi:uncharacterized protein (UPF0333 family)
LRRTIALLIAAIVISPVAALSQTKKRSTSRSASRSSAPAKASEAVRAGKARVADQVKNLTRFIYLLGGVAKGIEQTDAAIRRNEAPPAIVDQVKRNKETVKTSLRSVREGLDKLEIDFRATPELQRYYIKLAGVAAGAANAEELAAANQFDRAGRTLLDVVNRLTDVLLEMP